MFCSKCGANLKDDAKFCHQCGNTISDNIAETKTTIEGKDINKKKISITSCISFPIAFIARLIFQQEYREYSLLNSKYVYRLDTAWMVILSLVTLLFVALTLYNGSKGKFQNKQAIYVVLAIFTALALLAIFLPISAAMF